MSKLPENSSFGSFRIVRCIGGGGMAQIYLAKTSGLAGFEKLLALKVINSEYANEKRFIQMLIDEAKITVGLSHVNIAQVFDLGQYQGIYYIAMEFVDGCDILELVNGLYNLNERVPLDAICQISRNICAGLHYAHTRKDSNGNPLNIVHRDISPQNILVSKAGEVKIVDFGIAKAAGVSTKTQAGVIKGKVNYMAPEQATGQPADPRTDVFATGIVTWEMLTSRMAYSADNVADLLPSVRKVNIKPPSTIRAEIPPELDEVVMTALARDPKNRYQSAHEFQVALSTVLAKISPEYGESDLARIVGKVIVYKEKSVKSPAQQHLSKQDKIEDEYSLIFNIPDSTPQKPRLLINTDKGVEVAYLGNELVIGRAAQLVIQDAKASRQHAKISQHDNNFILEDLKSSNGTFVNGRRIEGPYVLKHGDNIRVGKHTIRFMGGGVEFSPVEPPAPKLVIMRGNEKTEHIIDEDFEITYRIEIGPVSLQGCFGRIVRKNGSIWLEPFKSRAPIFINSHISSQPTLLSVGDSFELAGMNIMFTT